MNVGDSSQLKVIKTLVDSMQDDDGLLYDEECTPLTMAAQAVAMLATSQSENDEELTAFSNLNRELSCIWGLRDRIHGYADVLINKDNLDFFRNVRITKEMFKCLDAEIGSMKTLKINTGTRNALLMTLWYLGNQCSYREISEQFGYSESTVFEDVCSVIHSLHALASTYIKWPDVLEVKSIEDEFQQMCGIPGIIEALDGCHIAMKAPARVQSDYLDRTLRHSVNLLAVCDSQKRFTYIYAGFPGSAHDSRVFKNSSLYLTMEQSPYAIFSSFQYHILADSAFPLSTHIIVPYKDAGNLGPREVKFNNHLSKGRIVIENSFGLFRRLKYIDAHISKITPIITACCVLHNLSLTFSEGREQEEILSEYEEEPSADDVCEIHSDRHGEEKRDSLKNLL